MRDVPAASLRRPRLSPVAQLALAGLLATVLIGVLAVAITRRNGTQEAIRDAKVVARLAGRGIVQPEVTAAALAGDPAALARLDRVVRSRVLRGSDGIVRVKVWTPEGRIVYSDEPRLIGARYELEGDELRGLRTGAVAADVSDLDEPENRFERSAGRLLQVYLPIRGPDGRPLLFEAYQRFSSVSASGRRLWLAYAPALVGGLLLLQLVNLPLAASFARRLRRGQAEREALLARALDASTTERRTIAADLHDGVVQDLVGLSFTLSAQAERLRDGDPAASAELREGAASTRASVRALRTLLVDIHPPGLRDAGLDATLADLATTYAARGLRVAVEGEADPLGLDAGTEQLLFRAAQEALRNVHRHAHATDAVVAVVGEPGLVRLRVRDDGDGIEPGALAAREAAGHVGLRGLRDLVGDAGGTLEVAPDPAGGTVLTVELPR